MQVSAEPTSEKYRMQSSATLKKISCVILSEQSNCRSQILYWLLCLILVGVTSMLFDFFVGGDVCAEDKLHISNVMQLEQSSS